MLKDILENGNIPFTQLLPNRDLIVPIALAYGYKEQILNAEYRGTETIKDEGGNDVENQIIGRLETNPETHEQYINRVIMDAVWGMVKPVIKDIMLAEQMRAMKEAEALIDAQLDTTKSII